MYHTLRCDSTISDKFKEPEHNKTHKIIIPIEKVKEQILAQITPELLRLQYQTANEHKAASQ